MDVAEDVRDARAREGYGFGGARFVEPEVKALAVEQGEDVVKEGVGVGELDDAADRDDLHVWDEGAILLQERVVGLRAECERGSIAERIKPDDSGDGAMSGRWCGGDADAQLGNGCAGAVLGAERWGQECECGCERDGEPKDGHQNLYPADNPMTFALEDEPNMGALA